MIAVGLCDGRDGAGGIGLGRRRWLYWSLGYRSWSAAGVGLRDGFFGLGWLVGLNVVGGEQVGRES